MSQSKNVASYDILAVLPLTPAAYQIACSTMEVDVVTYDPTNTATLRISRKLVSQAIERGVHFELQYAPCVIDSSTRRNTITMAHTLHAVSREAMPVLITSAASHPEHMRSPYDIANLGLIFGLSEEKSKAAMTHSCRNVLLRALARRNSKAVVNVTVIKQPNRGKSQNTGEDMDVENGNVPPAKRSKLPDKTHHIG
ncbi:hypothetical protein B566_EDAN003593 [Ephemera danica]|nr:hypothetical protein B566_EDAN003593 [Ephemera danica]